MLNQVCRLNPCQHEKQSYSQSKNRRLATLTVFINYHSVGKALNMLCNSYVIVPDLNTRGSKLNHEERKQAKL